MIKTLLLSRPQRLKTMKLECTLVTAQVGGDTLKKDTAQLFRLIGHFNQFELARYENTLQLLPTCRLNNVEENFLVSASVYIVDVHLKMMLQLL